jgi:hypothetical protein
MPVTVSKRGKKYRVVEESTGRIVKNEAGTAVDGGGKSQKGPAASQARAINANLSKRRKI